MKIKKILIVSFALFAMFFGAGNILLPPQLGLHAGKEIFWSATAFVITGVGLPLIALLVVFKYEGDYKKIFNPLGDRFYKLFLFFGFLAIGPLIAIPRTASTTFEMGVLPIYTGSNKLLITAIFFIACILFSLKESNVLDEIGKYLTPLLIVALIYLIVNGMLMDNKITETVILKNPFKTAFSEGYNTLDAIAAIIYGQFVYKAVKNEKNPMKISIISAVIAAICLSLVYIGLMYIGAKVPVDNAYSLSRVELITSISKLILGKYGIIILSVIVVFACLTTAIGLVSSVADYFEHLTNGKLTYQNAVYIISVISFVIAQLKVDLIITLAVPILYIFYQVLIVLLVLTILKNKYINDKVIAVCTYLAFFASVLQQIIYIFR